MQLTSVGPYNELYKLAGLCTSLTVSLSYIHEPASLTTALEQLSLY